MIKTNEEQWSQIKEKYPIGFQFWGKVAKIRPYGVFIKLQVFLENNHQSQHMGLIDIGHTNLYKEGSFLLPLDYSNWPQKGTYIKCIVCYYRERNKQLGLSWLRELSQNKPD